jgi:streptomycin 6-kinase
MNADSPRERFAIPESVLAGVEQRWPDRAGLWAATAPETLNELCAKYDAKARAVMNARYGFVVAVDTAYGGLVFRSSPDPDGPAQATVAAALANLGVAPTVHETILADSVTWTVMDEVRPGTPLAFADQDEVDLDSLAALFAAVQGQPAPALDLPSLIDWLRDRLEDDYLTEMPSWMEPASPQARRDALRVLDELAQDAEAALCHGDASTWNILASDSGGWKLIDPRGVSGESAYDLAVLTLELRTNAPEGLVLTRLADTTSAQVERVLAWRTVAAAARV